MICLKTYQACLAIIRKNSILRLALHCVMGPESYNSFILSKSIAIVLKRIYLVLIALAITGVNPFRESGVVL